MTSERAACRVERVETIAAIDALAAEWTALERLTREATGFQSYRWCRAWLSTARENGASLRPRILCIRDDERLVMLWPLQIEHRFGVGVARWIGEPMTQYGDALAAPGEGRERWRKIAEGEMSRWRDVDLFAFTRLRADSVVAACNARTPAAGECLAAPFVDLRAMQRRRRKSLERRARRLAELGPTTLAEAQTPAEREELTRRALALKREWLRRKGLVSAGLSSPITEEFLSALAREGFMRVFSLRVAKDVAALELGFVSSDAYRSLLGCYDPRFAEGSPGQALTGGLIERCAEEGLATYDLLLPADAYKLTWATGETPVRAQFRAMTFKGRLAAFALARLRPMAKRALRRMAGLRARLNPGKFSFAAASASVTTSTRKEKIS
ncbi:GNAT family N-acetyltransferase [Methylocystis sp. ATCC 49242]|uniref:GNAT family N-acetyltransferase n=1 Tax=Methylocystis sp. ATCC 49242 TaxID=622637 RepID=UPI0001F86EBA|nr:GNAT family N-acetyltransferase [Methylocystis sp. ATCC 49242]